MRGINVRGKEIRNITCYLVGKALCQQFFFLILLLYSSFTAVLNPWLKNRVANLCKDREKTKVNGALR